jgi:nucleotide-binding universal stress UspA family protein
MSTRRQDAVSGYHRILWPTDFSPLAKAALPHLPKLATGRQGELVIFHVLPSVAAYAYPDTAWLPWDQIEQANRAAGERGLHRLEAQIKIRRPDLGIRCVLATGVAFEQIVQAARRFKCDLIVLATHGRTGLKHVLMGSVAENVVRRAHCPVLTVRPLGFRG